MLQTTRGIVLKTVKYSESSVIVRIYTEHFGLRTYIIKSLTGKNNLRKKAMLQGLSLLNLVVYEKSTANLQHIKEMERACAFQTIPFDLRKSTIVLFLNEVLYKSIGEEVAGSDLFDFIYDELVSFDMLRENISDFHLQFLIRLSKYLGFTPRNNYSENNRFFDLQEGAFVSDMPHHNNYLKTDSSRRFSNFLSNSHHAFNNHEERNEMLEKIILYYSLHVPSFGDLKSFAVLKQVFN